MSNMYKELLSAIAITLTFIAFYPYIRSILQKKTKPHVFSWVIWGSTTFIVFLAQLADKGGAGAWVTGVSGTITLYIAILAYIKKSDITITRTDWMFFILAMMSLPFWYFTSDPLWAVVILTAVDIIGFGPTIRKAHAQPFEENLIFYMLFVPRNIIAVAALEHYSLTTILFPIVTAVACIMLILMIIYRRRMLTVL
ncbi:MAG: hypothetical protein L3J98_06080 [Gammaproteobacteria bacterium]|nr:hypothetical protein [Gammaproteobacteria bacterium]MCF6259714.1 hypothetical protein [Gammaproteobacteria bacterium]